MPPKSGATPTRPTILSSPSYDSSDTEAASQQLLTEASPVRQQSSAVHGANLLNAARMLAKPPAAAHSARAEQFVKSGKPDKPGKLKRASLFSEERQRKIRGENMWNLDPSPQKRSSLPAQIAALEEEHDEAPVASGTEVMVPETSQPEPDVDLPTVDAKGDNALVAKGSSVEERALDIIPASPTVDQPTAASSASQKRRGRPPKRKSTETVGGSTRQSDGDTAEVQAETEPSALSTGSEHLQRSENDRIPSTNAKDNVPVVHKRRTKRLKGWKDPNIVAAELEEGVIAPVATVQHDVRLKGNIEPEVRIPVRSTRLRAAQAEAENAEETSATAITATSSAQGKKSVPGATRAAKPTNPATRVHRPNKQNTGRTSQPQVNETADIQDNNISQANETAPNDVQQPQDAGSPEADCDVAVVGGSGEANERQEPSDEQDDPEVEGSPSRTANRQSSGSLALDSVFRFLDVKESSYVCSTNLGKEICRSCKTAREATSSTNGDVSTDDVGSHAADVRKLLRSVRDMSRSKRQILFKRDAYGGVFYELTEYLEAMYNKLQEMEGNVTDSLQAMQILHANVYGMLLLKDTIAAWKVTVPRSGRADRLIRDVEIKLISHLRIVEREFRKSLHSLKKAETIRQAELDLRRRREEQEEEDLKRAEAQFALKERRKRWQHLHIVRMQCEPDSIRRRRLRFVELQEVVERDADGNEFERLSVFGDRNIPPPQWTATTSGREWNEKQEIVLLDALQLMAGPTMLERLFKAYCRPGGVLRDFTVADFAAKLAWIRSGWTQLSQEHGWEVPDCVQKLPVLP
ncbi:hypothetical protein N0V94_005694 [Neodidymelliopsis sp. IMI 364377]|nr:hypothetical protein N0V94_005694 [Neodidymelliopsis sp. IMI 364377]